MNCNCIKKLESLKQDILAHPDYTVRSPSRWDSGLIHGINISIQKLGDKNVRGKRTKI